MAYPTFPTHAEILAHCRAEDVAMVQKYAYTVIKQTNRYWIMIPITTTSPYNTVTLAIDCNADSTDLRFSYFDTDTNTTLTFGYVLYQSTGWTNGTSSVYGPLSTTTATNIYTPFPYSYIDATPTSGWLFTTPIEITDDYSNFLWERNRLAGTSGVGYDYTDYVQDTAVIEIRADDGTTILLDESQIMTAESKEAFDPTGVTMPINSMTIVTTIDTSEIPDGQTQDAYMLEQYEAIKALLPQGSTFKAYVGFNILDDFGFEHRILQYGSDYTVDKVIYNRGVDTFTIEGSTYGVELNRIFNKGIYEPSGVTLQTRATRVFTDLGLSASDYDVTALDVALTSQMPVPVVTAREALTMIGSAAKCHLEVESNGVLTYVKNPGQGTWNTRFTDLGGGVIGFTFAGLPFFSTSDGDRPLKYTIPEDLYLGEPEEINDDTVFRAFGNRYTASVAASAETILETTTLTFTVNQGLPQNFILTHEAIDPSTTTITVTGATLSSSSKYTYATYINVTRTQPVTTFTVKIDAKKLDITSKVATTYTIAGITTGQELTYDNPIYTTDSMLSEVVTNIATVTNRPMITIPMRDDPKLFVGDSVMLSGMFVDTNYRYTLTEAKRTFDGALRAEYTFV